MQLRPEALDGHLAKGLAPLYVITSDEHLLALEAADKIRQQGARARLFRARRAHGRAQLQVGRAAGRQPGDVAVRRQEADRAAHPRRQARQGRQCGPAELRERPQPRQPDPDHAAQAGLADGQGGLGRRPAAERGVYRDPDGRKRAQLPGWIGSAWRSQGQSADRAAAWISSRIASRAICWPRTRKSRSSALLHEPGKLSFEQVQDAVLNVARYDVFKLSEAMLAGDPRAPGAHARRPEGRGRSAAAGAVGGVGRNPHAAKIEVRDGAGTAAGRADEGIPHLGPARAHDGAGAAPHRAADAGGGAAARRPRSDRMVKGLRAKASSRAMPGTRCCSWRLTAVALLYTRRIMDITEYMQTIGRQAARAPRARWRAPTAPPATARWLLIADAIERDARGAGGRQRARPRRRPRRRPGAGACWTAWRLSDKALATMVEGLRQIAALPDPIGEITGLKFRPSGIQVGQMRVPLGVIGIIYEAAPNVTIDAAAPVHQERQRGHPARRLRGASDCNRALAALVGGGLRGGRPAGRRGAAGRDHRPRRRRRADHHAGIRRRDRPARRQGPDRAPDGRGARCR